jgi:glyoxylase-like metal-dependent hydrolase (beta-lactamase superfamily II)
VEGHAKGMLGFIFDTDTKKIFFGTDASWSYDTYNQGILPFKIVKLFFDSWKDFVETQQKIRTFQDQNPMFTILFTHCVKTLNHIRNEI